MRNALIVAGAIAAVGGAVLGLTGCSAPELSPRTGTVEVVASTDAYGSIVRLIGGDRVSVTSIVSGPGADPQHYEVSAQDRLAVRDADLVVYNGGGYDAFMYPLLTLTGVHEIDAAVASGRLSANGNGDGGTDTVPAGFDEHIVYDLPGAERLAAAIADELTRLDGDGKATFAANLATFDTAIEALIAREHSIDAAGSCGKVVMVDPAPGYLLDALGCTDATPPVAGGDVSRLPQLLDAVGCKSGLSFDASGDLQLVPGPLCPDAVRLVAVSAQGENAQTARVIAVAGQVGVPVVDFTETLPVGDDYLGWMTSNLDAVQSALAAPGP